MQIRKFRLFFESAFFQHQLLDSKIFITKAIQNTQNHHIETDNYLHIGCTQVYQLGESIYQLVKEKLDEGHIKILENEL